MKTVFFRVLEAEDKASALRGAITQSDGVLEAQRFEVEAASFSAVPTSPFAYWVSDLVRQLFNTFPAFQSGGRSLSFGASTKNDFRFVRHSLEVSPSNIASSRAETLDRTWVPLAKGGKFSPFHSDVHLLVDWANDGEALKADISEYRGSRGWGYQWSAALNGHAHYFRPGLTWSRRTNGLSLRVLPRGCIFADKGPGAFVENDNEDDLLALAAITNSRAFSLLVSLQLARTELAQSYEVGIIQQTPIPPLVPEDRAIFASLGRRAWSLKHSLDSHMETSHAFTLPALLQVEGETLSARADSWKERSRSIDASLMVIMDEIDQRSFDLYGFDEADRRTISVDRSASYSEVEGSADVMAEADGDIDDTGEADSGAESEVLTADLVLWALSVAFGRFDVRLATRTRMMPAEPDPFEPLPACSPAMLTGDDGLPLTIPPASYPIAFPENGLLVDDPGHARDLTAAVRAVFDEVFKESADAWWNDVEAMLDPKDHDLRAWLAARFFEHHLKRYSKSRRKAPIIWQLALPSGRYSVWLYAHQLNRDSFIQIQNDLVAPKLVHEERQLTSLLQSAGANPGSKESKEIEAQETFVAELRQLLEEVKRVAPLWHPVPDDGVVLTMAPLWRLVSQHKPWQKELKTKWDDLVAGKYDWAHLAMHLWPERVVPKCAEDRSLAIAHGLKDVFWFEDEDGEWKPREKPQKSIAKLISERSSTAVKAALKGLLDAPEPTSGAKRGRKSKVA
jgi:hypothetical protein